MFPNLQTITPKLSDEINEVEKLKVKAVFMIVLGIIVSISAPIAGLAVLWFSIRTEISGYFWLAAAIGIIVGWSFCILSARGAYRRYRSTFKDRIVFKLAQLLIGKCKLANETEDYAYKCEYSPTSSISDSIIYSSGLFPSDQIDRVRGEDLVSGTIGLTEFYFSELELFQKVSDPSDDRPSRRVYKNLFTGVVFVAEFNKNFNGKTFLRNRGFYRTLHDMKSWFKNLFRKEHLKTIKLENNTFNRLFKSSTTDEIEARYILSPKLMELLLDFRKRHRQPIDVSFFDKYISLALTCKRDYFEPTLTESIKNTQIERIYNDLKMFFGIIEEFHLNTRIWSKYDD